MQRERRKILTFCLRDPIIQHRPRSKNGTNVPFHPRIRRAHSNPRSLANMELPPEDYRKPKNFGRYADIAAVLDKAIRSGGLRITFESPGAATNWIQQANTIRVKVREVNNGQITWDKLAFRIARDPETKRAISSTVEVSFKSSPIVSMEYLDPEFAAEMGQPALAPKPAEFIPRDEDAI